MNNKPPIELTTSRHFLAWLHDEQLSLAFTTYQTNRLFLIGLKPDGSLSTFERLFDRPMGLYATPEQLHMSSRYQLWRLDNALPPGKIHEGYDKLYVPRVGYTTGDLDSHDLVVEAGQIIFVNTLYSCLATLSEQYSFKAIWQPPFISQLAPEDRCHLNGLAMANSKPAYVTAISRSDVPAGWRKRRHKGGCLIDAQTEELILTDLSMPHSPRVYQERVWLLNSGLGDFGYVDLAGRQFEPVAFCAGYLRGLAFYKNFAVVGLSKPRRNRTFAGLPLDERLESKDAEAICGLMVIDLTSGHIAHRLGIEGDTVTELYDVQILPGVTRPTVLGFKSDEICRILTLETGAEIRFEALHSLAEENPPPPPPPPTEQQLSGPGQQAKTVRTIDNSAYRFQLSEDMTVAFAVENYVHLTFPDLRKQAQARLIPDPLMATVILHRNQLVGMALAELNPAEYAAKVNSIFIAPEHRGRGLSRGLLQHLEQPLIRQGYKTMSLTYRAGWPNVPALERMLQQQGWKRPQPKLWLGKTVSERIAQAPWLYKYHLPQAFKTFPWPELTPQERQAIEERQSRETWFPPSLTPFQVEERLEALNSLGLRYQGEVVGWMITHRTTPDTIQYTSLFVSPEFQTLGRAISMLAEAIKRQIEAGVPYFIFQIEVDNQPMVQFAHRRLKAYLTSLTESRVSNKSFKTRS